MKKKIRKNRDRDLSDLIQMLEWYIEPKKSYHAYYQSSYPTPTAHLKRNHVQIVRAYATKSIYEDLKELMP